MTTYVYETIPANENEDPQFFEIQQNAQDAPLTVHPDTGRPVRRVILGSYGTLSKSETSAGEACGPGCCCE